MTNVFLASAFGWVRFVKFLRRPAVDQRYLLAAIALHCLVNCVRLLMPRGPVWRRLVSGIRPWGVAPAESNVQTRVLWAIKTTTTLFPSGRNCLVEAVTAHWLFALAGCRSVVRIGVAPAKPVPQAHAWLECGGRTVLGGTAGIVYEPLGWRGRS